MPTTAVPDNETIWHSRATTYVKRVNEYLAAGERDGWNSPSDPPALEEDRALAEAALAAVRQTKESGTIRELPNRWPPVHRLLIPLLDEKAQDIPALFALDDGGFVARIGASYHEGRIVEVYGDRCETVEGVKHIGRCPNRRYFALADDHGVRITDGWRGTEVCRCPWPTGLEGIPKGVLVEPLPQPPPPPTALVPFPDGKRVLFACEGGVFVLTPEKASRLLPRPDHIRAVCEDSPTETHTLDDSMAHAAVSPDGKWIATGSQCSSHYVFDSRLRLSADIGHLSEYPHYACFSGDSKALILNSCHFYHGATLVVKASDWPGLRTPLYESTAETPVVEEFSRVYAAVHRNDEFIIGNANGYLRAFTEEGRLRWYHHIGSTISAIDLSRDGRHLLVSSCAGWVVRLALDTHNPTPHEIGSGNHTEQCRWLFWKDEPQPLLW